MPDNNTKFSYRFLRRPVKSETEIIQQRAMLRKDSSSAYAKLGYTVRASDQLQHALVAFSNIEPHLGKDINVRLMDIDKERSKTKNAKKLVGLTTQEDELRTQLASEQLEYLDIYAEMEKLAARLRDVRAHQTEIVKAMEDEQIAIFNKHRQARTATAKKVVKKPVTPELTGPQMTAAEILEATRKELLAKEAGSPTSSVVRKDEIPPGFKPIDSPFKPKN